MFPDNAFLDLLELFFFSIHFYDFVYIHSHERKRKDCPFLIRDGEVALE